MMEPYILHVGDCRETLARIPDQSVNCVVTSPPYFGLRDYGMESQIGLEPTPEQYVAEMVAVFREVRRVLRDDGTVWLNIGDSYAGSGKGLYADGKSHPKEGDKQSTNVGSLDVLHHVVETLPAKNLLGIPWRVAFALQADGWYLRQDIIWHKPNVMPESVTDRCTKSHEYLFLLAKSERYHYDADAIREPLAESSVERVKYGWKSDRPSVKSGPGGIDVEEMGERFANPNGRNKRSVWTVVPAQFAGAHFAVMPEALVEPCILAGCPVGGTVLDPFTGSGTVGVVAMRAHRQFVGCELNPAYAEMARERIESHIGLFNTNA